jgi:hypothetical protein
VEATGFITSQLLNDVLLNDDEINYTAQDIKKLKNYNSYSIWKQQAKQAIDPFIPPPSICNKQPKTRGISETLNYLPKFLTILIPSHK